MDRLEEFCKSLILEGIVSCNITQTYGAQVLSVYYLYLPNTEKAWKIFVLVQPPPSLQSWPQNSTPSNLVLQPVPNDVDKSHSASICCDSQTSRLPCLPGHHFSVIPNKKASVV